jgi:hypothetical protein
MTSISDETTFTNQKANIPCFTAEEYKLYREGINKYRTEGLKHNREKYNAYMRDLMRNKYRNNAEYILKEQPRNKLRYHRLKQGKLANLATDSKTS